MRALRRAITGDVQNATFRQNRPRQWAWRTRAPTTPRPAVRQQRQGRCHTDVVTAIAALDREMYSKAEAARLLRVAPSTLHYWLEGGERRGRSNLPILRVEATGSRSVTWAEFIEAAFLRECRRSHRVPMAELRGFIDRLDHFGVPYPLAHH